MKSFALLVCISLFLSYSFVTASLYKKKLPKITYKVPFNSPADQHRKEPVCKRDFLYKHQALPIRPQTARASAPREIRRYLSDNKVKLTHGPAMFATTVLSMLQAQSALAKLERSQSMGVNVKGNNDIKTIMQSKSPTLASLRNEEQQRKRINAFAAVLNNFDL